VKLTKYTNKHSQPYSSLHLNYNRTSRVLYIAFCHSFIPWPQMQPRW